MGQLSDFLKNKGNSVSALYSQAPQGGQAQSNPQPTSLASNLQGVFSGVSPEQYVQQSQARHAPVIPQGPTLSQEQLGQQRFDDFLKTLGAEQANIGFNGDWGNGYSPTMSDSTENYHLRQPDHLWNTPDGQKKYKDIRTPYSFGQATNAGNTPGFVDSSGGFIGYGNNTSDLRDDPYLSSRYSDYVFNLLGGQ
jgi:hypothetical protein